MNKSVGIKEIAELAGVSIGTVDRVLHNRPGVSKKTSLLIHDVIKKTGYKKNNAASRLKLAQYNKIKIAVLLPIESLLKEHYWFLPLKGIQTAVQELVDYGVNYTLLTFKMSDAQSFENQVQTIIQSDFNAIITVPYFYNESRTLLQEAKKIKIPVVFIDTHQEFNEDNYSIFQDSHKSGTVAARILHRIIGDKGNYLVINLNNKNTEVQDNMKKREEGFRSYFLNNKKSILSKIETLSTNVKNLNVFNLKLQDLLKSNENLGIFVTNSRAYLLPPLLSSEQFKNVTLVGYDLNERNLNLLKEDKIHFLLHQQPENQGYNAAKGLFKLLTENEDNSLHLTIPVEIFIKENL